MYILSKSLKLLVVLAVPFIMTPTAMAGVVLTDLGGNNYGVTLDPITFTVGSNQSAANRMVIEDFYTTNQTSSGIHVSGNMNWSLNGGPSVAISFETNNGGFNGSAGQVDPNDLLFNFTIDYLAAGAGAINAGDTVTLSTFDMIFNATPLRIASSGPFTAHLLNGVTSISTETVLSGTEVPEPATLAIFVLSLAGLGYARRKRAV